MTVNRTGLADSVWPWAGFSFGPNVNSYVHAMTTCVAMHLHTHTPPPPPKQISVQPMERRSVTFVLTMSLGPMSTDVGGLPKEERYHVCTEVRPL